MDAYLLQRVSVRAGNGPGKQGGTAGPYFWSSIPVPRRDGFFIFGKEKGQCHI